MMISIIVPVYNRAKTITQCITRIIESAHTDLEIVIVDDASTDTTYNECYQLMEQDNRIRLVKNSINRGAAYARNRGLTLIEGEHVCFVDSDDLLPQDALTSLLSDPDVDLVCGEYQLFLNGVETDKPAIAKRNKHFDKESFLVDVIYPYLKVPRGHHMLAVTWGKLFKTSIIRKHNIKYNDTVNKYEDGQFILDYVTHIKNCLLITDVVYTYQAVNRDYGNTLFNFMSMLSTVERFLTNMDPSDKAEILLECYQYFLKREMHRQGLLDLL